MLRLASGYFDWAQRMTSLHILCGSYCVLALVRVRVCWLAFPSSPRAFLARSRGRTQSRNVMAMHPLTSSVDWPSPPTRIYCVQWLLQLCLLQASLRWRKAETTPSLPVYDFSLHAGLGRVLGWVAPTAAILAVSVIVATTSHCTFSNQIY